MFDKLLKLVLEKLNANNPGVLAIICREFLKEAIANDPPAALMNRWYSRYSRENNAPVSMVELHTMYYEALANALQLTDRDVIAITEEVLAWTPPSSLPEESPMTNPLTTHLRNTN